MKRMGQIALSIAALMVVSALQTVCAQEIIEQYGPMDGLLRIGPEENHAIALTDKGHTLILPADTIERVGVAVFFDGWRVTVALPESADDSFDYQALSRGVAILRITTGNPLDYYFSDSVMADVATRMQAVLNKHQLAQHPLYFAGLSLGGTRAMKMAIFLKQHMVDFWAQPSAAVIVDAPLDMVRFWQAEQEAIRADFHEAAADEGRWASYLLEQNLRGTPSENPRAYLEYSPYVYPAPDGGNAGYLRDVPIRAYHEPDVEWWIANRRKSYYSMNSIDMAAMINELKLMGNEHAELMTTHAMRDGYADGSSPHTWSFVDNGELVGWFLEF